MCHPILISLKSWTEHESLSLGFCKGSLHSPGSGDGRIHDDQTKEEEEEEV